MKIPVAYVVWTTSPPFASQQSFLDPPLTSDGKPYAQSRYKDLVRERYLISKSTNTSYLDAGKITPLEKRYILSFIKEEIDKTKEAIESSKRKKK